MKQRLAFFFICGVILAVLIGLNAAAYVQTEKTPDSEYSPNRSSFNSGSTGTQAFYTLLSESGRKVVRWRSTIAELSMARKNAPDVFVLIGPTRRSLAESEESDLMKWVAGGGRLVLIDREPPDGLMPKANWEFNFSPGLDQERRFDASNPSQLTAAVAASKPLQPTTIASSLNAVQPSVLASSIEFSRQSTLVAAKKIASGKGESEYTEDADEDDSTIEPFSPASPPPVANTRNFAADAPAPPPKISSQSSAGSAELSGSPPSSVDAPIVHVGGSKNIVVEAAYGSGQVLMVSDPFIVSNAGIGLVDNAVLAVNLVSGRAGVIAFDEYHQGYGNNENAFFRFFSGTPVVSIFLQLAALVALILYSQSRRFARALPANEPDRLSKLEYISAMAELQRRTSAYDLAIENVYGDFRRRSAKLVGADNTTIKRTELATRVAERAGHPAAEVDDFMSRCESIIFGEPTTRIETIELIRRIRLIEETLGLNRRTRAKA